MIQAIGIDVVDLDRFQQAMTRWGDRFIHKILTRREIALCNRKGSAVASMAARFAAKEAFIKCLTEAEYRAFRWHRIEILSDKNGKPFIHLSSELKKIFSTHQILTSLTHSRLTAAAVVMIQPIGRKV